MTHQTVHITPQLDVQDRLQKLRTWRKEWQAEESRLNDYVQQLDPNHPIDIQKGRQIKVRRTYNRITLAQTPIEIDSAVIQEHGYSTLRNHLVNQFARLSRESRVLWIQNLLFLMTPLLRRLHDKFQRIRHYRGLGQQRNFLIGGPSGMGKTTWLDWMVFTNSPRVLSEYNHVPFIKVDAPVSNNSVKQILQQMILGCGMNYMKRDSEMILHDKVALVFQQCHVEVVIVDEIQHLKTHKMRRHLLEISNQNRGIPFVCASCNPTEFTYGDQELEGRWNDYFPLAPYQGKDLDRLLGFIELILPFTASSALGVRRFKDGREGPAEIIAKRTNGILRDIMILIADASVLAIERGESYLSTDVLQVSWQNIQENSITDVISTIK